MPCSVIDNVPALPGPPLAETHPGALDLSDDRITENTRLYYPLSANPNVAAGARGPHPQTIVLLTADAFGVLPPASILSTQDVMYHFVSGYTAKLVGTEVGVSEPKAAFSACSGAPFMPRRPAVYAELLANKMASHGARCILLNAGSSGGPHGIGNRMSFAHIRALLAAALAGDLDEVETTPHPIFNLAMPIHCPGVPDEILDPRQTWSDAAAYDAQAETLRDMFRANFKAQGFADMGITRVM